MELKKIATYVAVAAVAAVGGVIAEKKLNVSSKVGGMFSEKKDNNDAAVAASPAEVMSQQMTSSAKPQQHQNNPQSQPQSQKA